MGSTLSMELAAGEFGLALEQQIAFQLTSNHFPPVPLSMVEPCIQAITAVNDEESGKLISLPDGVGYKGLTVAPAWAIVEAHHLDAWIHNYEEESYDE